MSRCRGSRPVAAAAALIVLLLLHHVGYSSAELKSFELVTRHYYPAGFSNKILTIGTPDLYGYGFGSLEQSIYDPTQKIFYGGSELGFVTVSDFESYPNESVVLDIAIPLNYTLTDVEVCGDLLFASTKDDPNPGHVHVYTAAKRNGSSIIPPSLIQSIQVGVGPDDMLISKDCMMVATADEGEGDYDDEDGLINPAGSVSILRAPFDDSSSPPSVSQVSLNNWSDEELIEMGVHLPLSLNAMKYWSQALGVNFASAIENYQPEQSLEPEYLAWNADESLIYCNLQENNALVVIDVASNNATGIYPYGLKSGFPVDVIEDDSCDSMPVVEGLSFLRSVDSIVSFTRGGKQYVMTANEGDDAEYGDFAELVKASEIFIGSALAFANMTADESVFSPSNVTHGFSRYFNDECDEANAATAWCAGGLRLTVGSASINYSNPEAPQIQALVGVGGRGVSLYEMTAEGGMVLVYDSADTFEKEGCASFPWAHNGIQDEEFAPINGTFYKSLSPDDDLVETINEMNDPEVDGCSDGGDGNPGACPISETVDERSLKDGYAVETIVTGEACGDFYAVTASEKNSVGYLYNLTDPMSPALVQVFHLSPASETMNPGVAYEKRLLGEVDPESMQFLSADQSPTGKPAVLFSGAFSGTASLWEFACEGGEDTGEPSPGDTSSAGTAYLGELFAFLGFCLCFYGL